ncbi:Phosphoribosylformylglycinamidine synthase-like [Homarus americanus]|uniref:Phosphoribosylformylglycinamidine synthase n=1 Tax=Homarus americanus TaxID=6706 RepID=A0A8J5JQ07_HOMAM|nr:Phosphoribosylformylglycinamidine synthase-like [Homarus americanus]
MVQPVTEMAVVRVYRGWGNTQSQAAAKKVHLQRLQRSCPMVESLEHEVCYYILTDQENKGPCGSDVAEVLGGEVACQLWGLLGDPWVDGLDLHTNTQLQVNTETTQTIIEIGPRLNFTTAWSTNAVSICHAMGLTCVTRLERAHRYLVTTKETLDTGKREEIVTALHDPMTEQEYEKPQESFLQEVKPQKWWQVDVLKEGKKALQQANGKMGLAFDEWDIDYYTDMFKKNIQRNPTTVELFDLAQSNSEHSRHWFFKGEYKVEGEKLPQSLFDMVMATNTPNTTNNNNVIAFSDNSSGIHGWEAPMLVPSDPCKSSEFRIQQQLRHLIFTAETHNFPTEYDLPWESTDTQYPTNFASPLEVAIEASNGASDYGNKFGEPVIAGFARSFGLLIGKDTEAERREWIKPIMFSGGMGTLDAAMIKKQPPKKVTSRFTYVYFPINVGAHQGSVLAFAFILYIVDDHHLSIPLGSTHSIADDTNKSGEEEANTHEFKYTILEGPQLGKQQGEHVVKVGGPVYRIGVGGGAASSVQVQGDNEVARDLGAVQRGDAEMEQKMNRVIRGCLEMKTNPILAIHDQGAGGNGKMMVRLVEGKMDSSVMEKLEEIEGAQHPVDLHLDCVLGKMPKKEFQWTKKQVELQPLVLPDSLKVQEALERVLKLPSVASKRYLTNKVDRSVTGLVAQQQCVGPLHTPLADVAVTAVSYFSKEGTATSIGEQPIKMLVSPAAGARLAVLEALTNLAAAPISNIKDVKCSANWMWAAKLPGEGWALYQACEAMCEIMKAVGVGVDGGKDSLSMAARVPGQEGASSVVKAPGSLVVSAYAPCPDITKASNKIVTPDIKSPGGGGEGTLLWVRPVPAHARLAGSALAQVYSQVGHDCPDVDVNEIVAFVAAFNLIQQLIKEGLVLALHDVSDGGLVTCLLEMGVSGWCGMKVDVPPAPAPPKSSTDQVPPTLAALFGEEVGWVLEVKSDLNNSVLERFLSAGVPGTCLLGTTNGLGAHAQIDIRVDGQKATCLTVLEAARLWEKTSYHLEARQANPDCVEEEYSSLVKRAYTTYHVPFSYRDFVLGPEANLVSIPRVAVIREEGTNGDREMVAALLQAGFCVHDVTMTDLLASGVTLEGFRGVVFPGGFSYAGESLSVVVLPYFVDVLGSAVGWVSVIKGCSSMLAALEAWRSKPTSFSLGVCNGCQLMALLGWLDPSCHHRDRSPAVRLTHNTSGRFESRWSRVQIETSNSVLLKGMQGARLGVWVAHGEGRFIYRTEEVLPALKSAGSVALCYLDDQDQPTQQYPFNPNGSQDGVAGVTSPCGRHLALMPHPERCVLTWQWPYLAPPLFTQPPAQRLTAPWSKLFQNAFDWCLENP